MSESAAPADIPHTFDRDDEGGRGPAMRPKLAATLVLARQGAQGPEILMGKRAAAHAFMPQKFVFPGGRVDRADAFGPRDGPPAPPDQARLERVLTPGRARAAPLAALRETVEETGVLFARAAPADRACAHDAWRGFADAGLTPAVSRLALLARAVTPPGRTRRFDAWFFLARAEDAAPSPPAASSAELCEVDWYPLAEARRLDLPSVTRFVLEEAAQRLSSPATAAAPPYLRVIRGRPIVKSL